jgi:hypothetical protein
VKKYEKFFGPGVTAAVRKVDPEKKIVALVLTTLVVRSENGADDAGKHIASAADTEVGTQNPGLDGSSGA